MTPTVAFQGELGAFSEEAVRTWFGPDVEPLPCREFRQVGEAVRSGRVTAGLLPVENSLAGTVQPAYDVLAEEGLAVVGEVVRPIRHFLLGVPGATLDGVRRVISHPVALAQCGEFLSNHPKIEALAVYDTAGAAREVAAGGDPTVAALAAQRAAERYGLDVLAEDLQDRADNQTRFLVIRRDDAQALPGEALRAEHGWKTALLVETENRPGALVDILLPMAEGGVNLSKLESRPGRTPWSYRFFLEFEGGAGGEAVTRALEQVRTRAHSVRVLGTFHPWPAPADPA
ncbi:MAG: prephenate dehydratase [Gemmatimonadota bacterium]